MREKIIKTIGVVMVSVGVGFAISAFATGIAMPGILLYAFLGSGGLVFYLCS